MQTNADPNSVLLPCIEINPTSPAIGSVIWLHGLGADGHDFAPIVPELNLNPGINLRFIFPHAPMQPITINNGYVMRAWYNILKPNLTSDIDHAGIERSVKLIEILIRREQLLGIDTNKIVLAGFSQGAVIALTAGLSHSKTLAGIMALSGYLPGGEDFFKNTHPANQETPIFIAHGIQDPLAPYALSLSSQQLLKDHHYHVSWHSYHMGHSVCPEEIQDIGEWLNSIYR